MGTLSNFYIELRRRNVLRVGGLYIAVALMIIEGGDILMPLFDFPEPVFRWLVIAILIGFPATLLLAWFYEITDRGILTEEVARVEQAQPLVSGRRMDYIVIAVLAVALALSVTLNVRTIDTSPAAPVDPVTILIADFVNSTDESLFNGTLEEALRIGIEGAPFVSSFPRSDALQVARQMKPGLDTLDAESARLVAVREGLKLVLSGDAAPDGSGFEIRVSALNPRTGETVIESAQSAATKIDVLGAIARLADDVREELGDATISNVSESFTASNLEAVSEYMTAQAFSAKRDFTQAVGHYERAVELDPDMGRALSGWAIATFYLGQTDRAEALWQRALTRLQTMSERERLRTLGAYYALANQNYDKAVETYKELVTKYPADNAGYNGLAVSSFYTLDFEAARAAGEKALSLYPNAILHRLNFALYSMYGGDFATADSLAAAVIEDSPGYALAYLPQAIQAAVRRDFDLAQEHYQTMATLGSDPSLAATGLADLALFRGQHAKAKEVLHSAIAVDTEADNQNAAAIKWIMLAETAFVMDDEAAAREAIDKSLGLVRREAQLVPAARILLQVDDANAAIEIADELSARLQPQVRAYAHAIRALVDIRDGRYPEAIDALRRGLALADLWWLRYQMAIAYFEAGYFAEALAEFEACASRLGEGSAMFLDDVPTVRMLSDLDYWLGRANDGLGATDAATGHYQSFLSYRADDSPYTRYARSRIEVPAAAD